MSRRGFLMKKKALNLKKSTTTDHPNQPPQCSLNNKISPKSTKSLRNLENYGNSSKDYAMIIEIGII